MATVRTANAHWEGSLMEGSGTVELASSASGHLRRELARPRRGSQRQDQPGGAHRRGPLDLLLDGAVPRARQAPAHPPTTVDTTADVTFQPGQGITGIKLTVKAAVPGLTAEQFAEAAEDAKKNCPVSQALTGTTITLDATLVE